MGVIFECAVSTPCSKCSVLDGMQARVVDPTHLRSFIGLRSMCRRAAATPAHLLELLGRLQCRCRRR